ncbi:RNA polymerase sigma factor [Ruminococcus flavefaciens]|uniref:RNA polymerase sigma factor n=1 Tax=Ruminococcus flavefaciens TaxID=1265 RepID=UPI0002FE3A65|nr:sigma-70 family RNA polymerase sigma factor [Ruminococcus flavefaciens]
MTDNELQQMLKNDPEAGQRFFYDKYFNYVYTIVFAKLKGSVSLDDIDECVSDVFANCFVYFDKQSVIQGELKAFTASVARRKAIDTYRKVSRHNGNVSLDDAGELVAEDNVARSAEESELRRLLYEKVDELGEPDSTIIIQKYYFGRSSKEIAEIVELSADNVRVRCSRAIKRLKDMLFAAGFTR